MTFGPITTTGRGWRRDHLPVAGGTDRGGVQRGASRWHGGRVRASPARPARPVRVRGRAAPGTRGSAGRWPATSKAKAAIRGVAGWVRLRGRCKYVHVSSVAACSCALSCAHGKTGWASCPTRPRHASGPWRSRPRNRTHPAFYSLSRPAVDPRHAWMLFVSLSNYSIPMEIHPRMAWIYNPVMSSPPCPGTARCCWMRTPPYCTVMPVTALRMRTTPINCC